jgi:hypothetical protein
MLMIGGKRRMVEKTFNDLRAMYRAKSQAFVRPKYLRRDLAAKLVLCFLSFVHIMTGSEAAAKPDAYTRLPPSMYHTDK